MEPFIIAFALGQLATFVVVGVVCSDRIVEGFGGAAVMWAVFWLAATMTFMVQLRLTGAQSWAPVIAFGLTVVNGLAFRLAVALDK